MRIKEDTLQTIYEIVSRTQSIDTPSICLALNEADIVDPELPYSHELASWLNEWHREAWETTCIHVDKLIEDGDIVFTDDGELYTPGYAGTIE